MFFLIILVCCCVFLSIRSPIDFPETKFSGKFLIVQWIFSAKTSLFDLKRLNVLEVLLVRKTVDIMRTKSFSLTVSKRFDDLFEDIKMFSNQLFTAWAFLIFNGTVQPIFENLSITTKKYFSPPLLFWTIFNHI